MQLRKIMAEGLSKRHLVAIALLALVFIGLTQLYDPVHADRPVLSRTSPSGASSTTVSSQIFMPVVMRDYVHSSPLWRFGSVAVRRSFLDYSAASIAPLRVGWYLDFGTGGLDTPSPYGMEYLPMINVKQLKKNTDGTTTTCSVGNTDYLNTYTVSPDPSQIPSLVASHPGLTWIIGNEMERRDWGDGSGACYNQDEILPQFYAQAYHDLYYLIKGADPTAQVAIGGMVEFTDLRRQYLDSVWAAYSAAFGGQSMPVDVWNTHLYVLQEKVDSWGADIPAGLSATQGANYGLADNANFSLAWQQIQNLRSWMKSHGQQNKPLIITEYSVLFSEWVAEQSGLPQGTFSPTQVRDSFMYPSFNAFLNQPDPNLGMPADGNRLVQRWNWWSLDDDSGACGTDGKYYQNNNSNLLYSGLGPSWPPVNCSFPAQGRSPYYNYWTQYVQPLPIGPGQPYVVSRESVQTPVTVKAPAPFSNLRQDVALCPQLGELGSRYPSLAGASVDERIAVVSDLTAGTRVCAKQ